MAGERARPKSRAKRSFKPKAKGKAKPRSKRAAAATADGRPTSRAQATSSGEAYSNLPRTGSRVYLHVAEKPSVARELVKHLNVTNSAITSMRTYSPFNKVLAFAGPEGFRGVPGSCTFMVSSVTGHLMTLDFADKTMQYWEDRTTQQLFIAPINRFVPDKNKGIAKTLEEASKVATDLVLWLDCDREGENIAFEVKDICQRSNRNLAVHRAIFSSLALSDVQRAVNNLTVPDIRLTNAVNARQEFDLRAGCIFTRLLTTSIKPALRLEQCVSFGPCQFPTLRLVVDRFLEMTSFTPEHFWVMKPKLTPLPDQTESRFLWTRRRLFDREATEALRSLAMPFLSEAKISAIVERPKSRWRPIPLTTVAMTTIAARRLRIQSSDTIKIAERLYQQGYISYPRTETEMYPRSLPLVDLVRNLMNHGEYGAMAQSILHSRDNDRCIGEPYGIRAAVAVRNGTRNDEAHPPIHPVKSLSRESANTIHPDAYRLYDLVARHFLATLCDDAKGAETIVTLSIGAETFKAAGLVIHEQNFLKVYAPYETWTAKQLPLYTLNQSVSVCDIEITEGCTTPPEPYEEADLIKLMDRFGIGTDATMHEHIKTIQDRQYVKLTTITNQIAPVITTESEAQEYEELMRSDQKRRFIPTPLGIALIESFRHIGGVRDETQDLSRVELRSEMEADLSRIASGELDAASTLRRHLLRTKGIFDHMLNNKQAMTQFVVSQFHRHSTMTF